MSAPNEQIPPAQQEAPAVPGGVISKKEVEDRGSGTKVCIASVEPCIHRHSCTCTTRYIPYKPL